MTEPASHSHGESDGLWRWLVGGLIGGLAVLGLLIGAYEVGHHRGHENASNAATTTAATTTKTGTTSTTTKSAGVGTVTPTPALVARGKSLYTSDGCIGCHSLTGAAGAGPTFKGLAGAPTKLTTGSTVTADDAYIERSITDPDAEIVAGYSAGIMAPAIASFGLATKPDDLRALIAFIKSQK